MSNPQNESWQKISGKVSRRLFLLLVLFFPVFVMAWLLTVLIFFHNEHPFATGRHSDYEKLPNAMGTYLSVPTWFCYGIFAGWLAAYNTSDKACFSFLVAFGVLLSALCLFLPDTFWTDHRPAWVPAVAALGAAIRASQFFVQRTRNRSQKTGP